MKSKNFSDSGLWFVNRTLREVARGLQFLRTANRDRALARAIDEGMQGAAVNREELFEVFL
jgi:hypothetical protein